MDMGSRLRTSRETLGLSLALIAQRTRVQPRIISAIEHNDLSGIPPRPFGRAFIKAYATEVGLDPETTARDYFAQFAPVDPPPVQQPRGTDWPRSPAWSAGAAVIIVIALTALAWTRSRSEEQPATPLAGGAQPAPAAAPADVPPPRVVGTAGSALNPTPVLTMVLAADDDCWVTATADGRRVLFELVRAGSERTVSAEREIVIRAGDAGALRASVNGRDPAPLGARGEVRTARFAAPAQPEHR